MNKDFLVFLVPLGIFLAYWIFGNKHARPERIASRSRNVKPSKEQRNQKISAINLLFKHASKEFKEYKVVNKNGKILICELAGARNELRELVFISINPLAEKSIQKNRAYIVAIYCSVPTGSEMRRDFASILH